MAKKSLSDRMRAAVKARGWSAYKLGKVAEIPEATALRFMRADNEPAIATAEAIWRALGWELVDRTPKEKA